LCSDRGSTAEAVERANIQALRAQERKHISVVLTKEEVHKVLQNLNGIYKLVATLMYGCGRTDE